MVSQCLLCSCFFLVAPLFFLAEYIQFTHAQNERMKSLDFRFSTCEISTETSRYRCFVSNPSPHFASFTSFMASRTLFTSGYGGQIHTLSFTPSTSSLSLTSSIPSGSAPTWLYQHPSLPILYTGDEFSKPHGILSAFKIDQQTMTLTPLEGKGRTKEGPVHFVTSQDGKQLFSACYASGALSTTKLREDGTFVGEEEEGGKGQNFVFGGKGVNPERQEGPHAHGV